MGDDEKNLQTYELICSPRFTSLEKHLNSIDQKLDVRLQKLESKVAMLTGGLILLSILLPLFVQYNLK